MTRHNGTATFSADGLYRYELGGDIGHAAPLFHTDVMRQLILWIMLNPSKAGAVDGDNTVDKIVRFSERWGFGGVLVGNLYGWIATDPKDMQRAKAAGIDIVGPGNDEALVRMIAQVRATGGRIMVAWGKNADRARAEAVHLTAGEVYCLATNRDGSPVHPLYQREDLQPILWPGYPAKG